MVKITLPDGSVRQVEPGATVAAVVAGIGKGLARAALAAVVDDRVVDLSFRIERDCTLKVLTFTDALGREVFRHTSTHIMAQAVKRLFPEAKLTVGPPLADGYFYDIDTPRPLSLEDLPAVEAEMQKIIDADYPISRRAVSRAEAIALFTEKNETYKIDLVGDIPADEAISLYQQGEFVDLCAGPHVPSTGRIKAFKLLNVAGAYWRGDQSNKQLQRLYGTSFEKKADLDQYLWRIEEAKKRDHRKLGPELDLFSFREEAPGFAFWHAKGTELYRTLVDFSRELQTPLGYQEVQTPWIMRNVLWQKSGHWDHYRENMFVVESEDEVLAVKPMNCPAHCLLYGAKVRSYRDLPIKIAEYGPLSRFERSGTLHGLLRVRGMHQDDAHIFCREDQIEEQIREVLGIVDRLYAALGMPYQIKLSTRPDDFLGEIETWNRAEAALAGALASLGREYVLNPGDGAFYGPKLDFDVTDALGRQWQCATVQLDFQLPLRFDLSYVDQGSAERRPVMIHRAIMGTLERFIGILVEHFAGAFPTWLSPVQVRVLPIADRHHAYARSVAAELKAAGIRTEIDERNEKIGYKIRQAQVEKVPYMLVLGDKEAEAGQVAVRHRRRGDVGVQPVAELIAAVRAEIAERRLDAQ